MRFLYRLRNMPDDQVHSGFSSVKEVMVMAENQKSEIKARYTVVIVDTDLRSGTSNSTALRFFDKCCDAELWIAQHGARFGVGLENNISRFFRIEKRYYLQ